MNPLMVNGATSAAPPQLYPQAMVPHFNMRPTGPPSSQSGGSPFPASIRNEISTKESTVFVGNISESAADDMIRAMLNTCGFICQWKRAHGSSGKMQGFGFCTFQDPDSAIRAIKMLDNLEVAGKKLVVKVDDNTKEYLEAHKKRKQAEQNGNVNEEDQDRFVKQALTAILENSEHCYNQDKAEDPEEEDLKVPKMKAPSYRSDSKLDLEGMEHDLDESTMSLISQEISKFRGKHQNEEAEDDLEKAIKKRTEQKKRAGSEDSKGSGDRSPSRRKSRGSRDRDSRRRREGSSPRRDRRDRERRDRENRSPANERRKRAPSHSPSPVKDRIRRKERDQVSSSERTREREPARRNPSKETRSASKGHRSESKERTAEEEEELRAQLKLERRLREKEDAYQERLKNWETREKKKIRDADKDKEREKERIKEQIKEAKRLKEFLEEYDDERDDPRYYVQAALARRIRDREKEKEIDERDRVKEKEELDEILTRLKTEGHPNPEEEIAKLVREFEAEMNKPLKERERELKDKKKKREKNPPRPKSITPPASPDEENRGPPPSPPEIIFPPPQQQTWQEPEEAPQQAAPQQPVFEKKMTIEFGTKRRVEPVSETSSPKSGPAENGISVAIGAAASPSRPAAKKKLPAASVFGDDDDDGAEAPKKKRLIPENAGSPRSLLTTEQKQQKVKELIGKIPSKKEELFLFEVDWSRMDELLMEKRIRPWVNKKIIDYIGDEEATLVDFICGKVKNQCKPDALLSDIQMVLDDEAEVFVVKLWRLLIYETEAKKAGLSEIK